MSLHAVDNVEAAFDATRSFLTPFERGTWARLALVALFVGGGVGLPTAQFNASAPADVPVGDLPVTPPVDLVTLVVAVVAVGLVLAAGFALIGAVMEFVLVESLREGVVSVRRYWSRHWRRGLRLFGFRVAIGLPFLTLVVGWVAALVLPLAASGRPGIPVAAFVALAPVVFVGGLLYGVVAAFTTAFVVPIMIRSDVGVLAAWRRLWGSVASAWKEYLAYAVVAFLLTAATGVVAAVAVGIVAVALLVPALVAAGVAYLTLTLSSAVGVAVVVGVAAAYALAVLCVSLVVRVPIVTFLRYYALLVLGDVEPAFDVLDGSPNGADGDSAAA
jgi:hypothetical protein